ncbi:unnamed protein product [Rhizophagus irregularis]|nr:unnamed protein product [Rhizophagus irregularis]
MLAKFTNNTKALEILQRSFFAKTRSEGAGATAGFPDHPHRGFETVTYLLEGAIAHEDFGGNKGDVQWMTAGRGIVHAEMPASNMPSRRIQLWINLSREHKMIEPAYQDLKD